jgi:uncharacterized protein
MKTSAFLIFLAVVLAVYFSVNYYIFIRGLQALPAGSSGRTWFVVTFWLLAACFVVARILERTMPCTLTEIITWIGSLWLAAMLFLFLFVLVVDIFRVLDHMFGILPAFLSYDIRKTRLVLFFLAIAFTLGQTLAGFINARIARVVVHDICLDKPLKGGPLTIAMASDIHLGTIIGKKKAEKLVEMLNGQNADIILLAGDVVDEDIAPVIRKDIGQALLKLHARYGVYAITGNHEYIGGAEKAVRYLTEHHITFLRDTSVFIDGRFYLAGREDRDKERFTGVARKPLNKVLEGIDFSYPVVLMDHQPFSLDSVAAAGVDLQLSGHTHHGQIWPFNYITKAIYTISWGFEKIGPTNFYVSCGFGTWGPPIRLGNRPEVLKFTLSNTFNSLEAR